MPFRLLHTADWHLGKVLRGESRLAEQREVAAEIVSIAAEHRVDAVLVAGDLFDSTTPGAAVQRLAYDTLLSLADTGASVMVLAGNHDQPALLEAHRDLLARVGVTMLAELRRPDLGGRLRLTGADGTPVDLALLPWLNQRQAIRSPQLLEMTAAEQNAAYAQSIRQVVEALTKGMDRAVVRAVAGHLTVVGATMGGGERAAHTVFDYAVPATAFPSHLHYVALGHLHRRQNVAGPTRIDYSGSPLAVDFGETENTPSVLVADLAPDVPAKVSDVPIAAARRLRTLRGTMSELEQRRGEPGESDLLRVVVTEPLRAGMREEVLELFPQALQVQVQAPTALSGTAQPAGLAESASPAELFARYCQDRGVDDAAVRELFASLYEEVTGSEGAT